MSKLYINVDSTSKKIKSNMWTSVILFIFMFVALAIIEVGTPGQVSNLSDAGIELSFLSRYINVFLLVVAIFVFAYIVVNSRLYIDFDADSIVIQDGIRARRVHFYFRDIEKVELKNSRIFHVSFKGDEKKLIFYAEDTEKFEEIRNRFSSLGFYKM